MSSEAFYRNIDRKNRTHQHPVEYAIRPVEERVLDFDEAILGFDEEAAIEEASRCVQCPEPQCCMLNCPLGSDITEAMWLTSQGDFVGAAKVFAQTNPLPEICGRVCPNLCRQGCVLSRCNGAAAIGKVEAFVADYARKQGVLAIEVATEKSGKRVAVVGSGPAGLTVAEDLLKLGHAVTVYDAWPMPGGVLVYGIPSFKLNKAIVLNKIADLQAAGVTFVTNTRIGSDVSVEELQANFDAVFLGTGAGIKTPGGTPGEDLDGVYDAVDFLMRANLPPEMLPANSCEKPVIGRKVAIVGGGDTAVDCARTSLRLGAEKVSIVCRRPEAEMRGNAAERQICLEEGATINYLQRPIEYVADENGHVKAIKLMRLELGEPDKNGQRRAVPAELSAFEQDVDTVVLVAGYSPNLTLAQAAPRLNGNGRVNGTVSTNGNFGATTHKGVFAAGGNVNGADSLVMAIASAHQAAESIDSYLGRLRTS